MTGDSFDRTPPTGSTPWGEPPPDAPPAGPAPPPEPVSPAPASPPPWTPSRPATAPRPSPPAEEAREDALDSGHPDEPTITESIDDRMQQAGDAARAAVADGPLAIVAIVLTVVSFLVGQAGTSISYLRIDEVDYAHIINEGVVGTAGVTAAVGLVAAIIALVIGTRVLRTWRMDLAVAALILGVLSAGLHGTIWYLSIQKDSPPAAPGQLGP